MMGGGMMGGNIGGFGLAGGLIGLLFNIALIIGIIVLIIWAVQKFSSSTTASKATASGQSLSAREIADIRYASGELTREEYQSIRHDVSQS